MRQRTTAHLASAILITLLLATPVFCAQEAPGRLQPAFEAIDAAARRSMEKHRTVGMALAVTSRDKLLFHRTYGFADLKLRTPVTSETLFQIGSISKSFTAVALLRLAERIDLHRPVVDYLPWFAVRSDHAPITAHHLLSHTAGILSSRDDITSSPLFMAWSLRDQATAWPPGERYRYSNVGFQVLHALLEEVSGQTYARQVREGILEPLRMGASKAGIRLESRLSQAVGYLHPYDDRPPHRSRPLIEAPFAEYLVGDGCVQSTATDMAAYTRMILNRGAGPGGRILSRQAFDRFVAPHIRLLPPDDFVTYGYGIFSWSQDDHDYIGHSGGMVGLHASFTADMTAGLGVVVLVNGPGDPWGVKRYALSALRAVEAGEALPPVPAAEDPERVENALDYAGVYRSGGGGELRFEAAGDRLHLRHGGEAIVLEEFDEDTFYTPHRDFDRYPFAFSKDDKGVVSEVTHGAGWFIGRRYGGPKDFTVPAGWQAYTGRYRSYSPWFPYFEVIVRKGRLIAITGLSGETSYGEVSLAPLGGGRFRVGEEPTPETLRFETVVSGRALSAVWSGHRFYLFERAPRPSWAR